MGFRVSQSPDLRTIQLEDTIALRKRWTEGPCTHPQLAREVHEGVPTGDYACTRCGRAEWGPRWNRNSLPPAR